MRERRVYEKKMERFSTVVVPRLVLPLHFLWTGFGDSYNQVLVERVWQHNLTADVPIDR